MYKYNKERPRSTVISNFIGLSPERAVSVLDRALSYRTFDLQTDSTSPLELLQLLASARVEFFTHYIGEGLVTFLLSCEISFSPEIYKVISPNLPVIFECEITSIHRSSYNFKSQLSMPGYPSLAVEHGIGLTVDLEKRKSIPFPNFFTEKYKHLRNKQQPQKLKQIEVPARTMCQGVVSMPFRVQVPRRHRDVNNHIVSYAYLEYCIDALEFHLLREDVICDFNTGCLLLKNTQFAYWRECSPGDILHVAFWDEEGDNSSVRFHLSKSGICIFQAKMQFFGKQIQAKGESKL